MLTRLLVRNLAVTAECSLSLAPGMTVFTGETGAGKSVLVSAIALVLGARADSSRVRSGTREALVVAEFDIHGNTVAQRSLEAQGIESDGTCLIRRQIAADGGSRAFVNDVPVTLKALTAITQHLVAIHGQHAHYELAGRDAQRVLLDAFGGHVEQVRAVSAAADLVRDAEAALAALTDRAGISPDREAFLRFQIAELDPVALAPEDWQALDARHRTLTHGAELAEGLAGVIAMLEDDNVTDTAIARLTPLERYAPDLEGPLRMLADAEAIIADARSALRRLADTLDMAPEELAELETQVNTVLSMARKHRIAPESLAAHLEGLREELLTIENLETEVAERTRAIELAREIYQRAADALTQARDQTAARFGPEVTRLIADLGMPEGQLEAQLRPRVSQPISAQGQEEIEFMVSTNAGQPLQPLSKVASGGELSRISLAIQTATAALSGVPVLVYDEVDTGISGRVAELVGRRLRETAAHRQVLCVTHLPQVASLAQTHFSVRKQTHQGQTEVSVTPVVAEARVDELARMLSGVEVGEQARAAAAALLTQAEALGSN